MSQTLTPPGSQPCGSKAVKTDRGLWLKWSLAVILPLVAYFGASIAGIDQKQCLFYGLTVVALVIWALGLLSDSMVAIALPVVYVVTHIAKPQVVFGPWSSSVGWVVLGGVVFAAIMTQTGFARRLALWAMHITSGSFNRLLWGILLAGFLIAPAIPSVMGKAALVSTICIGICEALHLEKKSPAASAVILAGFMGIATSKIGFLTGGGDIVMYTGQMAQVTGHAISWGDYFIHNFPLVLIYAPMSMLIMLLILRPKTGFDSAGYVAKARKEMGPMSRDEKKTGLLTLVLIALLVTDRWHGMDAGWVIILLSLVAFLPPVGLMTDGKLQKLPLAPVFFVVGCMSIGAAAKAVGVDKSLAQALAPMLANSSETTSLLLAYCAGAAVNFLLTPLAALSAMTVPLTELALELGLNPIPIMYGFSYGLEQYIFPYEFAVLLFFYATGWVHLKHIIMVFAVRFVATLVFLAACAMPYWKFLGLFEPMVK